MCLTVLDLALTVLYSGGTWNSVQWPDMRRFQIGGMSSQLSARRHSSHAERVHLNSSSALSQSCKRRSVSSHDGGGSLYT